MKFLSQEWFDAMVEQAKTKYFTKPNRMNMSYCEVYENCPGDEETVWTYFVMKDGMVGEARLGYGDDDIPEATYRCFGDYEDYVKVLHGELDPNMGIVKGIFTLEGNLMKAMTMLGTYNNLTKSKQFEGLET